MTWLSPSLANEVLLPKWRMQLQGLEDLQVFLEDHSPQSAAPLPAVTWRLDEHGRLRVNLDHMGLQEEARPVLEAYAAVFGTTVELKDLGISRSSVQVSLCVRGQIGPGSCWGRPGRTVVWIERSALFDGLNAEEQALVESRWPPQRQVRG